MSVEVKNGRVVKLSGVSNRAIVSDSTLSGVGSSANPLSVVPSAISHTGLIDIGSNTHAQIDSHIVDSSIHFTQGSISHNNITDIGSATHDEIDSRLAALESGPIMIDDLSDLSQFLVGSTYELPSNQYLFRNSINFGTANIKIVGTDPCVVFNSSCIGNFISYTGSTPFITSTELNILFQTYNFFFNTPNATTIDLANGNSYISTLVVFFSSPLGLDLDNFSFITLNDIPIIGCTQGILANNAGTITAKLPQFNLNSDLGGTFIKVSGASSDRFIASTIDSRPEATESFCEVTVDYGGDVDFNGGVNDPNTGGGIFKGSRDQKDPKIISQGIKNSPDSAHIGTAYVNNNTTVNGPITNNVFTDMVFGPGTGLIAGSTMERWQINDVVRGIFEYTGEEEFSGSVEFDFTVVSSGGAKEFRFKWVHDTGSGFADLDDPAEALQDVGSTATNATKRFPIKANKGDLIKPQITRNSGTSNITTKYATIYIS